MEKHKINLTVDVNLNKIQSVTLKQYSKDSQWLVINITENGIPVVFSETDICMFKMRTPDGRKIYNEAVLAGSTAIVEITANCCAYSGTGEAELNIMDGNSAQIATMNFYVAIEESVYENEEIEGSDEFGALVNRITQADELIAKYHEIDDKAASAAALAASSAEAVKSLSDTTTNIQTQLSKKAPTNHASSATTYGKGTSGNYGHLKISDSYSTNPSSAYNASSGVAASLYTVQQLYSQLSALKDRVTALDGGGRSLIGQMSFYLGTPTSTVNTAISKTNLNGTLPFTVSSSSAAYFTTSTNVTYHYKFVRTDPNYSMGLYYNTISPPTNTASPSMSLINSSYMVNNADSLNSIEYGTIEFITGKYYYGFLASNTTANRGGTLYLYTQN